MPNTRIEIDSLEYTRDGLRTREPLQLESGRHHRIVLVRPTLVPVRVPAVQGFSRDSSFPLVGTLEIFWSTTEAGTPFTHHERSRTGETAACFQVFGHASASGDEAHNKTLSERRAAVGIALLRCDAQRLAEVGEQEGWGTRELQAILRTLGCDPGPIDGEVGRLTNSALATFTERYNAGVYHRRHDFEPRAQLEADRPLGKYKPALFDAFVAAHGSNVTEDALHPTHPAPGCSEYNALAESQGTRDRRLTLVAHPALSPYHANAPCTQGDHQRCAVVDDAPQRCMWFREHVREEPEPRAVFCDPRWLWLGDDRYLLSALTTVADGEPVEFTVYDTEDRLRGSPSVTATQLDRARSPTLHGLVRHGVAQVVWKSAHAASTEDGRPAFDDHPVFRVHDPRSAEFAFCPWPERQTLRLIVTALAAAMTDGRPLSYRLRAGDGSYEREVKLSEATVRSPQYTVLEFPDVPLDTRVTLTLVIRGRPVWDLIRNVLASALPGNCASGTQCRDLPAPKPPPSRDRQPDDEDATAVELSYLE